MKVHALLALTLTGLAPVIAQSVFYRGYISPQQNCPGNGFVSATVNVGGCVQTEVWPTTSISVTQVNPCPAGSSLQLDVSENDCSNFVSVGSFLAGTCTNTPSINVAALKVTCV
ncbi:hypothetical protein CONLIGDRAFT_679027 [Coniochaeta ligniaria NRRL 30616]|uniref:Uncharacterized protein n=1 Tax=Coniochaeta ligniaria NRRL 30616 TaxID=1408157 RepID=A0A1J7JRN3_9PEZI|nr:hypothetical protein CONLIGDRAFT_679027 [Coniochaeta ligniaria NRRL 30616]